MWSPQWRTKCRLSAELLSTFTFVCKLMFPQCGFACREGPHCRFWTQKHHHRAQRAGCETECDLTLSQDRSCRERGYCRQGAGREPRKTAICLVGRRSSGLSARSEDDGCCAAEMEWTARGALLLFAGANAGFNSFKGFAARLGKAEIEEEQASQTNSGVDPECARGAEGGIQ